MNYANDINIELEYEMIVMQTIFETFLFENVQYEY